MLPDGELFCVAFLTDTERALILDVLRRDEELRQAEEQRVRRLKSELLDVKKRGAKRGSRYYNKRSCARCQEPLSPLGAGYCHGCNHQVCSACRAVHPNGFWVCNVCAKEADCKKSTGDWFYDQRVNRFSSSPGHGIVRASLRKRPPLKMRETVGKVLNQNTEMRPSKTEPVPQDGQKDQLNFEGTFSSEPSKASDPSEVRIEQRSDVQSTESLVALRKVDLATGQTSQSDSPGFQESTQTVPAKVEHASNTTSDQASILDRVNSSSGNIFFEDKCLKLDTKRARKPAEYSKPPSMLDLSEGSIEVLGGSLGDRSRSAPDLNVQEEEEEEVIDNLVKFHSSSISKSSLGSMTSMYSGAGDYTCVEVSGEILFSLAYDECTRTLSVLIKECHNLAYGDTSKLCTSPYVKCYLLPGKSHHYKKKTSVKHHTVNPAYNENLKFSICHSQLLMRTLLLSVWHYDLFGHNAFLGEVELPLDCKDLGSPQEECIALRGKVMPHVQPSAFAQGQLVVSLKYVTADMPSTEGTKVLPFLRKRKSRAGELHIHIKEARELIPVKGGGALDSFVKGYLLPAKTRAAKKKTPVVRMTLNPHYDHTFIYKDLSLEQLQGMSLELTVWDHETMSSNNFLGGVRLNSATEEQSGSTEVRLWQKMMQYPDSWAEGTLQLRSSMGHSNGSQFQKEGTTMHIEKSINI